MDGLIIRLRTLVRVVVPILRAAGWEEADLRAISPAIRAAAAAGDEAALRRWCAWLSSKLPACPAGEWVAPVLPVEMETRALDREWARANGAKR